MHGATVKIIHDIFRHVSGVTKIRYLRYADMLYLNRIECARAKQYEN
jgi:hypothetical protein